MGNTSSERWVGAGRAHHATPASAGAAGSGGWGPRGRRPERAWQGAAALWTRGPLLPCPVWGEPRALLPSAVGRGRGAGPVGGASAAGSLLGGLRLDSEFSLQRPAVFIKASPPKSFGLILKPKVLSQKLFAVLGKTPEAGSPGRDGVAGGGGGCKRSGEVGGGGVLRGQAAPGRGGPACVTGSQGCCGSGTPLWRTPKLPPGSGLPAWSGEPTGSPAEGPHGGGAGRACCRGGDGQAKGDSALAVARRLAHASFRGLVIGHNLPRLPPRSCCALGGASPASWWRRTGPRRQLPGTLWEVTWGWERGRPGALCAGARLLGTEAWAVVVVSPVLAHEWGGSGGRIRQGGSQGTTK